MPWIAGNRRWWPNFPIGYDDGMGDDFISSRSPEGPLNFCPVCGAHCRIEPTLTSLDATCPRCGSLLWFQTGAHENFGNASERGANLSDQSEVPGAYWEPRYSAWLRDTPLVVTIEDLRSLEVQLRIRLPRLLTLYLSAQNGGRLIGTDIDIYPIQYFTTLNDGKWAQSALVEIESTTRDRMVCVGTAPGGSVVLDYRRGDFESGARIMDHIFDGEVTAEFSSFEHMIRACLKPPTSKP